jgi:hypothetical protein
MQKHFDQAEPPSARNEIMSIKTWHSIWAFNLGIQSVGIQSLGIQSGYSIAGHSIWTSDGHSIFTDLRIRHLLQSFTSHTQDLQYASVNMLAID